jgi:ABC-2 type transport system ATP-binding protein
MTETRRDTPLVTIRGLAVSYGPLVALDGVDLTFLEGATGLLGPNGAGKTTLLKALLGFVHPQAGSIEAFGLDPRRQPLDVRQRIGYLPEGECHVAEMTAAELVSYAGELSGLPRADALRRAHEVLDYVALGELRYRPVESYSTGMRQRTKLAAALVHDPDLLLLDEPTNGLDPVGRDEMLTLLCDVARRGRTSLVLSSHLLKDVEEVCGRVIVLDQGKVAAAGSLAELTGTRRRRSAYDVRLKGDATAFLTDVRDEGGEWREGLDGYRVLLPEGQGPESLFRLAQACGVQLRHLRPATESLEDVFLRALGGGAEASR